MDLPEASLLFLHLQWGIHIFNPRVKDLLAFRQWDSRIKVIDETSCIMSSSALEVNENKKSCEDLLQVLSMSAESREPAYLRLMFQFFLTPLPSYCLKGMSKRLDFKIRHFSA